MKVLEIVENLIRQDPSNIKTKQDALKHVFLSSGNGLMWEDGEVQDYIGLPPWTEAQEYVSVEELPSKLQSAVRPIVDKRVSANRRVIDQVNNELESRISSLTGEVFVERGSLAWTMPDDVSNEWKNAFHEFTEEAQLVFDES